MSVENPSLWNSVRKTDPDENLSLWNSVRKTDPEYTTWVDQDGGYTSIDAYYMIRQATEQFGPMGIGWGFEVVSDSNVMGHLIEVRDGVPVHTVINVVQGKVWYMLDGKRGEVTQSGNTKYIYKAFNGLRTDPQASKKSQTDCLTKCLSLLGFSADIYMGQFEDQLYREEVESEFKLRKADNKAEEIERQRQEHKDWVERHFALVSTAVNTHELEVLYKTVFRKLKFRNENDLLVDLQRLKDKRKAELEDKPAPRPRKKKGAEA